MYLTLTSLCFAHAMYFSNGIQCNLTTGFDPWVVSKKGLADLLGKEDTHFPAAYPQASNGGIREEKGNGREDSPEPWQDELRSLFPSVNISFGCKV